MEKNKNTKSSVIEKIPFLFFLLAELVGITRMGYDTFVVSGGNLFERLTAVILIDGILLGSLMIVAYAPEHGDRQRLNKLYLSIIAWSMFIIQIVIGWQATGFIGLAVRVAVGIVLAYHTGEQLIWRIRTYINRRKQNIHIQASPEQTRKQARNKAWNIGYKLGSILLLPVTVVLGMIEQVLALVFVDMFLRALRRAKDVSVSVLVDTPDSRTLITHSSSRTRDAHNISHMITSGEHVNMWQTECDVCGAQNIHGTQTQSSRAYAGHSTSQLHKQRIAQATHAAQVHIIEQD